MSGFSSDIKINTPTGRVAVHGLVCRRLRVPFLGQAILNISKMCVVLPYPTLNVNGQTQEMCSFYPLPSKQSYFSFNTIGTKGTLQYDAEMLQAMLSQTSDMKINMYFCTNIYIIGHHNIIQTYFNKNVQCHAHTERELKVNRTKTTY